MEPGKWKIYNHMLTDPITLIFLSIAVVALAILLLVVFFAHAQALHKLQHEQKVNLNLKEELGKKPIKLLEKAHYQALDIIAEANRKANDLLTQSQNYEVNAQSSFTDAVSDLQKQQQEAFTKASEEIQKGYQEMLSQMKDENINEIKNVTKDIENDVLSEFKEFTQTLEKETMNSEKVVKEKINEEYLALEKELETYRKEKYQKVDEDIYKILYRVSELVLSQGISFDKHKELVFEALEEAKKEQVFQ